MSNNLNQTLASGERVLSILEEEPLVEEIPENISSEALQGADKGEAHPAAFAFTGARAEHVTFAYEDESNIERLFS